MALEKSRGQNNSAIIREYRKRTKDYTFYVVQSAERKLNADAFDIITYEYHFLNNN